MQIMSGCFSLPHLPDNSLNFLKIILLIAVIALAFVDFLSGEKINIPLKMFPRSHPKHSNHHHHRSLRSLPANVLHGQPGQGYYLELAIGTPPQKLNVLVDTGSSNFAIAAAPNQLISFYFHREWSSSYHEIGTSVYVPYTQGNWKGILGKDKVTLIHGSNLTVRANIACITDSHNFFINGSNWQGILGLAYENIARPDESVKPYFNNLVSQAGVPNIMSMQLCGPVTKRNQSVKEKGGTLILGDVDDTMYKGSLFYTPVQKEWYYEVLITDILVGDVSLALDCKEYNFDKTIVDSGTTNLRLPSKVFNAVVNILQSKVRVTNQPPPSMFWMGGKVLCWKQGDVPYRNFPTITLSLAMDGNTEFQLVVSPQQYLRAVGDDYDPVEDEDCFKFAIAASKTGSVIGAVVMEGFYVVFDRANRTVGFAETSCAMRDPKAERSKVLGPFLSKVNVTECLYRKIEKKNTSLIIVAYIMAGICAVCTLPLLFMIIQWQIRHCKMKRELEDTSSLFSQ